MIRLFKKADDLTFESNGDLVIDCTKARVFKEDNGEFYLYLETNLSYINDIVPNIIIVAPTPQGDQAFRVTNIDKKKNKIKLKARHIFYDSENFIIADSFVENKDCNYALDYLNKATNKPTNFITISDVTTINSFRCVRKSLAEAIQTVLGRWGGHLVRDNFKIEIRNSIGEDNGVIIQYKKNLKEITCEESWDNVVNTIMPVGKDGQLLPELYLESEIKYPNINYSKVVTFSQDIDKKNYLDEAQYTEALIKDLRKQAQDYLKIHQYPEVNYTLKANIDKVTDIGDLIKVFDQRLNIEILTNVISYTYDCIQGRYIEIEFGNFKKDIKNLVQDVTKQADEKIEEQSKNFSTALDDALKNATKEMWSAMGESHVIYDGDKILIVDKLPKEDAKNVILINNLGIAFSKNGINGEFVSAWTIDGTFNAQNINVINFTADLIKGGILKLGSQKNQYGSLEIYNADNDIIATMDKDGLILNNSSSGKYKYTYLDLYLALSHIKGTITLPQELINLYDTNNDGTLNVLDIAKMQNIITGALEPDKYCNMSIKISTTDIEKSINVRMNDNLQTLIGLFQIYSYMIKCNYLLIGDGYSTNQNEATYGVQIDGKNKKIRVIDANNKVGTLIDSGQVDAYNVYCSSGNFNSSLHKTDGKGSCVHSVNNGSYHKVHHFGFGWADEGFFQVYVDNADSEFPIPYSDTSSEKKIIKLGLNTSSQAYLQGVNWIRYIGVSTSDKNVKHDIKKSQIKNALDVINKIKFKEFKYNDTNEFVELGIIANDLEKVNKNFVNKVKQPKKSKNRYVRQIDTFRILPYELKAIQELDRKNKNLEKKIDFLIDKLGFNDELKKYLK